MIFKSLKIKLALRNISRSKPQSLLVFLCGIIAAFTIFIQLAQRNSVETNLKRTINEALSGQVIIYNSDKKINILESQFTDLQLFNWPEKQSQALRKANPHISSIAPRLRFGGLIAYKDATMGLNFQALTTEHMKRMTFILDFKSGRLPENKDEMVINELIADYLKCQVGDTLVVLSNNKEGYMSDGLVVVSGVFGKSGVGQFLIPIGYVLQEKGIELLGIAKKEKMELVVNFNEFEYGSQEAALLKSSLFKINPDLKLAPWQESAPVLSSIVDIWKNFGRIIQCIFVIFSFLILINIILMITKRRKKEIGTLLAIGFKPNWIVSLVALEYFIITIASVLLVGAILKLAFMMVAKEGIPIPWEAMQVAYLSTHIKPELFLIDILFIGALFGSTAYLAVVLSLRKLRNKNITSLLLTHT